MEAWCNLGQEEPQNLAMAKNAADANLAHTRGGREAFSNSCSKNQVEERDWTQVESMETVGISCVGYARS
jgi:hypothetical protein